MNILSLYHSATYKYCTSSDLFINTRYTVILRSFVRVFFHHHHHHRRRHRRRRHRRRRRTYLEEPYRYILNTLRRRRSRAAFTTAATASTRACTRWRSTFRVSRFCVFSAAAVHVSLFPCQYSRRIRRNLSRCTPPILGTFVLLISSSSSIVCNNNCYTSITYELRDPCYYYYIGAYLYRSSFVDCSR